MKIRSRIAVIFILFTGFLHEAYAQNNSLLWEITGNGLTDTSYLYGTIHIRDKRVFKLGDSTYYAINRVKALFGELNLQDKDAMKEHASELLMPTGTTLESLISPEDYALVKKYCKKHIGIYALLINKIKPIFLSAVISENLLKKEEKKPLDMYLQDYAAKQNKVIGGIETFEEQLAVLNIMSIQEQADMLVEQVKNIEEEKKLMEYMLQSYLSESLDSLEILVQEDTLSAEFNEAMLDARNKVMAQRMTTQMKKQSTFFAVGAAHLPGSTGLIVLLRKQGYTVRPVKRKYSKTNE
jgi:uncharacterized protein YbaP (TraB family)